MDGTKQLNALVSDTNTRIEGIVQVLLEQSNRFEKTLVVFRSIRVALWITNFLVLSLIVVEAIKLSR